eukprot:206813-Pelagomonas_calceolata.AAC.2
MAQASLPQRALAKKYKARRHAPNSQVLTFCNAEAVQSCTLRSCILLTEEMRERLQARDLQWEPRFSEGQFSSHKFIPSPAHMPPQRTGQRMPTLLRWRPIEARTRTGWTPQSRASQGEGTAHCISESIARAIALHESHVCSDKVGHHKVKGPLNPFLKASCVQCAA